MRFNFWKFFLWYLIFYYLIDGGIHAWIKRGYMERLDVEGSIYEFTSLASFFLFSIGSYLSFFYFYGKKKWLPLLVGVILSFILPMFFRFGLEQKIIYYLTEHSNYPQHTTLSCYYRDQYLFGTRFIIF